MITFLIFAIFRRIVSLEMYSNNEMLRFKEDRDDKIEPQLSKLVCHRHLQKFCIMSYLCLSPL